MLEILALCSCACIACLWCATAFAPSRRKHRSDRNCFFDDASSDVWKRSTSEKCKYAADHHKRSRKNSWIPWIMNYPKSIFPRRFRRNSSPQPVYRLVCKSCWRPKHCCICANLFHQGALLVPRNRCPVISDVSGNARPMRVVLLDRECHWQNYLANSTVSNYRESSERPAENSGDSLSEKMKEHHDTRQRSKSKGRSRPGSKHESNNGAEMSNDSSVVHRSKKICNKRSCPARKSIS